MPQWLGPDTASQRLCGRPLIDFPGDITRMRHGRRPPVYAGSRLGSRCTVGDGDVRSSTGPAAHRERHLHRQLA
jgi:hypothetical protein